MGTVASPPSQRRRWLRRIAWSVLGAFLSINGLMFFQARAMTRFQRGVTRMPRAEELSFSTKVWYGLFGAVTPRPENSRTPADFDLPYTTQSLPVGTGVTLELWRVSTPDPQGTVIALHGYGECKSKLLPEAAVFHELGYSVVLVDFRGSGGSSECHTSLGVEEAEDLRAVWKSLSDEESGQPIFLFGRSMGSVAALRAMGRDGVTPAGAILECPFDRMATAIRRRCDLVGVPRFPATELLLFWGSVQLGMNAFQHNPVDYAGGVSCPVLLLRGEADPRVHQCDMQDIADRLPRPPTFEVFDDCTHEPCVLHDRARFRNSVQAFLDSCGRGS